jgi:hypothetical protein
MEKHRKLLKERKSKGGNKSFVYENLICQGIEDNVIKVCSQYSSDRGKQSHRPNVNADDSRAQFQHNKRDGYQG